MLSAQRRHDRLVVDTGIGHENTHGLESIDGASFQRRHLLSLPKTPVMAKIDSARIGNHRDAHLTFMLRISRQALDKLDACLAERLGISHDVRLGYRDQVGSIEKPPNLYHVFDRPAARCTQLTVLHGLLFFIQFHLV